MNKFVKMISEDYRATPYKSTVRNPQSNVILERIHQTLGNILRTYELHEETGISGTEAWDGVLMAVMFALHSMYHTTLQTMPAQLVFGRDSILNTKFRAIKQRQDG